MSSDDEVDPISHAKLLDSVSNLRECQHIRPPKRFNLSGIHDEFHLSKPTEDLRHKGTLVISDVINILKNSKHADTSKQLSNLCKTGKVLKPPLEKPEEQKLTRTVAYEKAKKDLGKWNAVVAKNRYAETQTFPLDMANDAIKIVNSASSRNVPVLSVKTDLMMEFDAIDAKLRLAKAGEEESTKKGELTQNPDEEDHSVPRKLLKYLKMRQNQIAAKIRMQNRIKSKSYHKLKKREKFHKQIEDFGKLRKTNPEAALNKLNEIEKHRVLERANLRHKNTGVWAKNMKVRAKFDDNVRKDLEEQLSISRQLTQKQDISDNEHSDNDAGSLVDFHETVPEDSKTTLNPWEKCSSTTLEPSKDEGYRKYWAKRNESNISKNKNSKKTIENGWVVEEISRSNSESEVDDLKNLTDLSFKNTSIYANVDEELNETSYEEKSENISTIIPKIIPETPIRSLNARANSKKSVEIINLVSDDYEDLDFKSRHMEINEAFEDDDIVADFKNQEKSKVEETDEINLIVPGWGSWAGADISQDETNRKIRTLKFPQKKSPFDLKETVYVNNEVNKKMRKHLMSDVPFPFTSVKDFEASIRSPISRSFVPEKSYRLLTKPSVITRKGHIIDPMDESELVKHLSQKNIFKKVKTR